MKCPNCHEPRSTTFTRVVNGLRMKLHRCANCGAEWDFHQREGGDAILIYHAAPVAL